LFFFRRNEAFVWGAAANDDDHTMVPEMPETAQTATR